MQFFIFSSFSSILGMRVLAFSFLRLEARSKSGGQGGLGGGGRAFSSSLRMSIEWMLWTLRGLEGGQGRRRRLGLD